MELITLKRDVEAIQIPFGQRLTLPRGSEVSIHQVLGGNFTVQTDQGGLVRVDGKDADALGMEAEAAAPAPTAAEAPDLDRVVKAVWDRLKTCFDPEIPVDIVELGLVYECKVAPEEGGFGVDVRMTLTAPGCGMGPILQADAEQKIRAIAGVGRVNVELVLDPPWDPGMMSEAARLQLGMM
ncbi:MAG: putative Fe-S cluster assembly protein SufT [Planctomycetes bacterium]|nr:putative Fe-S cluster assembly protein SufT [Planctomycetota bacterium]